VGACPAYAELVRGTTRHVIELIAPAAAGRQHQYDHEVSCPRASRYGLVCFLGMSRVVTVRG
jgi:hypothetical protein